MKIACITVTTNEFHLLESWKSYYDIYKDEIDLHIIVDNASSKEFKNLLYTSFPDSVILEQGINGGVTAAYNTGIKFILNRKDIGFILLACPDIKFKAGSISLMRETLDLRPGVGITGPLMYDENDKIAGLGARLSKYLSPRFIIPENLQEIPAEMEVDFISGGINMIKREVYDTIGLQDENLFMYGDELDFDLRAKNAGYKLVILKEAVCWHMHIYLDKKQVRSKLSYFLFSRNTFALYRKYLFGVNRLKGYLRIMYYTLIEMFVLFKIRRYNRVFPYLHGLLMGMIGYYKIPKIYLKAKQ